MSNPFYNYSGAFIPGLLARAEAEATEFNLVAAGFSLLAFQGTDSGAANAYVVTTQGAPTGSYSDGQIVEFKAANANNGNSTINVNGIGVVGLVQSNGQTLAAGAIVANTWYRVIYNSTYSAFTILAPVSQVITSNTIAASPPTFKVGLTAAGGVSTACAPIDVVFALDQSIAPTWTGVHIFSNTVTFASTVNFTGGLTLTGLASQYAITLDGNSTPGNSFGLHVAAGLNASDVCALFASQGGTAYLEILGEGSIVAGNPTGGAKGVGTINAQNLYVNGTAVLTQAAQGSNPTATVSLSGTNGTATTYMRSDAAPALSQAIAPTWTAPHIFTPVAATGTAIAINLPVNGIGVSIVGGTNTANNWLLQMISSQAAGFSSGLLIEAGTNANDSPIEILNAAATQVLFQVFGDGQAYISEPTASNIPTGCHQIGYMDAPQVIITASGTLSSLAHRGKAITHASGAPHTVTLPVNGSIPFPPGTTFLVVVELGAAALTIQPGGTATLNWAGNGSASGARVLTAPAMAVVHKHTTDTWMISGAGVS